MALLRCPASRFEPAPSGRGDGAEVSNLTRMKRLRSLLAVGLVSIAVLAVVTPAVATESTGESETETTETTVAPEPEFTNGEPAIVIPSVTVEEEEQPWTARFIYPTIVAVTLILIIGLSIGYNRTIRNRYKVVAD